MNNKNNAKYDFVFTEEEKQKIKDDYVNGLSIRKVCDKYNIKCNFWVQKLLGNLTRSTSEANKNAHKLYPNNFKLSDVAKNKIREARIKFMMEHPEETAWRKCKHNISYPEQCFMKYIYDRKLDKKYHIEKEKSVFPYYIDFAFTDIMLAVEIDGSQHLEMERYEKDIKKDELLISLGWKVVRIAENVVKNDWNEIDKILLLDDFSKIENKQKIGLFNKNVNYKTKKIQYIKKVRNEFGRTLKQEESSVKQRKVERPSFYELEEMIKTNSFVAIGKKYGVCDKTIVKWCKYYKLPHSRKDIVNKYKF